MMTLLAGHWGAIKTMTDATHAGDKASAAKAMSTLMSNASDIAVSVDQGIVTLRGYVGSYAQKVMDEQAALRV